MTQQHLQETTREYDPCPGCGAHLGHTHNCSYMVYVASLEPCPECGRVDEMDNITGQLLCAACYLDQQSPGCELCGSFSDDCDCWEAGDV